jgi:mRNA interferase YafQ
MYYVIRTKDFERSYRQIQHSGKLKPQVKENLDEAIGLLSEGKKLPAIYRDHQLKGEMRPYRECHIKGDLLLVYQVREQELLLVLVEIGTHAHLNL